MIDYSKLYVLRNKHGHFIQLEHSGQMREGYNKEWAMFSSDLLDGIVKPDVPLKFIYRKKSQLASFVMCGLRFYLFHKDLVEAIKSHKLTGIDFYPTVIEHKKEKRLIDDYFGVQVSGRYAQIDKYRGYIVDEVLPIGNIIKKVKGFYFTDDVWSGDDFSVSEHHSFIVVTEKVKILFEEQKVKLAVFIPLDECLLPFP